MPIIVENWMNYKNKKKAKTMTEKEQAKIFKWKLEQDD